jgi:hypothetical protein
MGKMSAISQFVPGTQARASRLFGKSLRKKAKGADAVLWVEYVDGDVKLKRAKWDGEINGWVTKQGKRFFPRGKGGDPKRINGVPIVQCHASDAGVVSTEAAMATGALEEGLVAPLDHRGRVLGPIPEGRTDQDPEAVQQEVDAAIENGELNVDAPENGDAPDGDAAADGGTVQPADYLVLYDGVEFRLGDAVDYDPFPVREEDARQAAEWFELAGRDDRSYLRYVAYGAVGSFLIVLGLIGFVWLLGEIGSGDSTGVSLSIGIDSAKLFASIMAATLG